MPLVLVTVTPAAAAKMTPGRLSDVGMLLREVVAKALDCDDPQGRLCTADIELSMRLRDPMWDFGGEGQDFQVIVFANDFPSRRQNLQDRVEKIKDGLRPLLPNKASGFVWVRLAPAAFVQF